MSHIKVALVLRMITPDISNDKHFRSRMDELSVADIGLTVIIHR
jgi:hypothetical protein